MPGGQGRYPAPGVGRSLAAISEGLALPSTYAPLVDEILIDPADMFPFTGSAAINLLMGTSAWGLDDAAVAEAVGRTLFLPAHWENMNAFASWGSSTATLGVAVFRFDYVALDPAPRVGPASFSVASNVNATVPADAADIAEITLVSDLAVDPTKRFSFRVLRLGSNASDTLVGDAQLTEVRLVNADA